MTIIYTALSGALAAQAALNTSGQNIANVMTPGYTRQGALLSSIHLHGSAGISAGSGVAVPSLLRFSDDYKVLQMWQSASELGQHNASTLYLRQLEEVVGNPNSSVDTGLDEFFAALNAASVEPTSSPLRQQVIIAAEALAQRFNSLTQVLTNQKLALHQQRAATVVHVNSLSAEIAALNEKIAAAQHANANISGLLDERDRKIDALASLVAVQVVRQPDGTASVALKSGQPLVFGAMASTMTAKTNADGSQSLELVFAKETFAVSSSQLGGEIGGLNDFEHKVLAPLMQSINDMAGSMAGRINDQLMAGYDLQGNPGGPLFEFDAGATGTFLKVVDGISGQNLGFSAVPGAQGNSANLLAVIAVKDQPMTIHSLGNVLLGDVYTQLVGKLGMQGQQNAASLATARTVRTQAEESWKSSSGVNTDEEAANLMQYQQMYQANMKVIAVANQLFDSTLSMFGH